MEISNLFYSVFKRLSDKIDLNSLTFFMSCFFNLINYQLSVAIGARNITADTRSAGHLRLSSMQASDK